MDKFLPPGDFLLRSKTIPTASWDTLQAPARGRRGDLTDSLVQPLLGQGRPQRIGNPHIDLRLCRHGGHCGFVAACSAQDDGYWAEDQIMDFVQRH